MVDYYQVFISAETKKEALSLLNALVKKNLAVGGTVIKGPSIFWWKDKITNMPYFYACPYTIKENRKKIIKEIEKLSNEEVPVIYFFKIDFANKKFLNWIKKYTKRKF